MLRIRSLAATSALAVGMILGVGALDAASACGNVCTGGDGDDSGSVSTDGQSVTVTVTGTLVGNGSSGSPGSPGSTTVTVEPPCSYFQGSNGKEWYEFWYPNGGDTPRTIVSPGDHEVSHPPPGTKKHKKDTDGYWWHPSCTSGNFDGNFDEFIEHAEDYFEDHNSVWVDAGETPPIPPIPPELLLQAAEEAMTVPDPQFEWNPKRAPDQGTLVNLPTWFWLEQDLPTEGSVTASVNTMAGSNSVTVEMGLVSVAFAGGDAGSVTCPTGGTPWTANATSDCTLAFGTAGQHTITADSRWEGSWSFNGTPQGAVDPIDATWSTDLTASEVQSLVTGVN